MGENTKAANINKRSCLNVIFDKTFTIFSVKNCKNLSTSNLVQYYDSIDYFDTDNLLCFDRLVIFETINNSTVKK